MFDEQNALKEARLFNRQALASIYDEYSPGLYRYAMRLLGNSDIAEDCVSETFSRFLKALRDKRALDFAMLMVTDVVRGSSRLLIINEPPELNDLPYPAQPDGTRRAEGVVSRKKQLLPVVLGLLER